MYLGIDLGTSAVKALLVDDAAAGGRPGERAARRCSGRSRCGRSRIRRTGGRATAAAVGDAARAASRARSPRCAASGLSGQMHGATLLDAARPRAAPGDPVERRPQRRANAPSSSAARRAAARSPATSRCPASPRRSCCGWRRTSRTSFAATARVLLPKDYLRLRLTGEYASEMSDAAGTLWLDVGARAPGRRRCWPPPALDERAMPRLVEGMRAERHAARRARRRRGACDPTSSIAGGGGDNAAGAVGVGVDPTRATPSSRSAPRASTSSPATASRRAPAARRARLLPLPAGAPGTRCR